MIKRLFIFLLVGVFFKPTIAAIIPAGKGSYTTTLPTGKKGPSDNKGNAVLPRITTEFNKPILTHQWWSSLIWKFDPNSPHSLPLYIYPLTAKAQAKGLEIGYTTSPSITPEIPTGNGWNAQEYHFDFERSLLIGVANLSSTDTKVADYSDWTVTASWQANNRSLKVTLGRGLPFAYCIASGDKAEITCAVAPTIWYQKDETLGITVNNKHFGIFAPRGSQWEGTNVLQSTLNGKDYFSVALLPDNTVATLLLFQKHAYAFVTNTKVNWKYDQEKALLTTTYSATTQLKETSAEYVNQTLQALYRHQWLYTNATLMRHTYESPRGIMKLVTGNSFSTTLPFKGILPVLPLVAKDGQEGFSNATLFGHVDQVYKQSYAARWNNLNYEESYWIGKAMGKIAQLILIADQIKHIQARDLFLKELKEKLEAWYSANTGDYRLFYYDDQWDTLIGYPESFGSDNQLNDHHFHWGYYIIASAVVAHFDKTWAQDANWGAMTKLIMKDAQNWSRLDKRFPFLGYFDVYEGHSWANGPALFGAGNNQESSSEAINFAAGVFLWGAATNNNIIRDLGIYLYCTEITAIQEYWFDISNTVFPIGFTKPALGILWGNGGAYAIWFAGQTEQVHGINFLPITSASLYLGQYPEYLQKNLSFALPNNTLPDSWQDIILEVKAMYNPSDAWRQLNTIGTFEPEAGESRAHTYHWLANMNTLGLVDTSVRANIPTYGVFLKDGKRIYVAYNYSAQPITVLFSDGKQMAVGARAMATSVEVAPVPDPEPDPVPEPPVPTPDTIFSTGDFTAKILKETSIIVEFNPKSPATFVDLHYRINNINQQNVRMVNQNGIWRWTISGIKADDLLSFFFTYTKNSLAYDSAWFNWKYA